MAMVCSHVLGYGWHCKVLTCPHTGANARNEVKGTDRLKNQPSYHPGSRVKAKSGSVWWVRADQSLMYEGGPRWPPFIIYEVQLSRSFRF